MSSLGGPCPLGDPVLWGGPCPLGVTLSSLRYPVLSGGGDRVLSGGPVPLGGGPCLSAGRAPVSSGPLPPTPWLLLMYLEVVTLSPPPGFTASSEGRIGEMGIIYSLLVLPAQPLLGPPQPWGCLFSLGLISTSTHTYTHTHKMSTFYIKLNSRWLRYLHLKNETLNVPEKTRKTEDTLEFGRPF